MESQNPNDYIVNFQNFKKEMKTLVLLGESGSPAFNMNKLFELLCKDFNTFHQMEPLRVALECIHDSVKIWVELGDYLKDDIGVAMINFIGKHRGNEEDLHITLQIVYQFMNSIKHSEKNDVPVSENLVIELITMLWEIKSRSLVLKCIACIKLCTKMYPENSKHFSTLWSNLKTLLEENLKSGIIKETEIVVLMQLVDDLESTSSNFYEEEILISTIQQLLKSEQRIYRKSGYYLLKKLFQYFVENLNSKASFWISTDHNNKLEKSWIMYITVLENLEEEQSHLILPSLANLKELVNNKPFQSTWFDILYMRMLTHNSKIVLRWSIEFFFKKFTCTDLCTDILKHLLQATNSNLLYNYEGYFLNRELYKMFLKKNLENLLTLIPEIHNWKSIPLYMWLENIKMSQLPIALTYEGVLKISACVRKLQNCAVRSKTIEMCNKLFKDLIEEMSMEEYVTYVKTLYNSSDKYEEHKMFFSKKSSFINAIPTSVIFNKRFYEIFTNNIWNNNELLSFLYDIPKTQYGWLIFAPFHFKLSENNFHKLADSNILDEYLYSKIKRIFHLPLQLDTVESQRAAVAVYIYQQFDFEKEDVDTLHFIFNTGLNTQPLISFAETLLNNPEKQVDKWIIEELLKYDNCYVWLIVINYLQKAKDEEMLKYAFKSLESCKEYTKSMVYGNCSLLGNAGAFLYQYFTDVMLKIVPSKGEKRVEESFCYNHLGTKPLFFSIFRFCFDILKYGTEDQSLYLLEYHNGLTKKKQRYFPNSYDHRVKLRIAYFLFHSLLYIENKENILDQIWNILLNENNQLNIVYIYEYILSKWETRQDVLLNKLGEIHNLSSSQQISIMSVLYGHHVLNKTMPNIMTSTIVRRFLALTMGDNFLTRLFAQMSLYNLLQLEHFSMILSRQEIIDSIECVCGSKLEEYLQDIRFQIYHARLYDPIEFILFVSNVPFDEIPYNDILNCFEFETQYNLSYFRQMFMKNSKVTITEDKMPISTISDQIQRKMNPINDLTEPHNLIIYPPEEKLSEMFVVASLIDKLPNLGGIARTCEVLGVQNLVMDSKKHTEKSDFKKLSMTAENTLNIYEVKPKALMEFLMNKKLEGFSIVGAEQTNNSHNFCDFKFPQKCVLLLGHEKDGIPPPLLGLLDYAVEIPQFGQVRSLNVHVTGALFMWEYCNQHLVPK